MKKKDISDVKKILKHLGFTGIHRCCSLKRIFYAIVLTILTINAMLLVIYKWDEVDKRIGGIKSFGLYFICIVLLIALTFYPEDSISLINITEQGLQTANHPDSTTLQLKLERRIASGIIRMNTIWYYAVTSDAIIMILAPLAIFVFRAIQNGILNIDIDMLYLPFAFYFPENYKTLTAYFTSYVMESIFIHYGVMYVYVILAPAFSTMQLIEGELKLLKQFIEEMDYVIAANDVTMRNRNVELSENIEHVQPENKAMKKFLRDFVKLHQNIYRRFIEVRKGIKMMAFSINSGMSILLCTAIYTIATTRNVMAILQEVVHGGSIVFCLYCYGSMGENISSADEDLRRALYNSSWINKPHWFKKSFLIIMSKVNKTIEMKSVGLFELNLKNFVQTVRAAYSFYNILSNLK